MAREIIDIIRGRTTSDGEGVKLTRVFGGRRIYYNPSAWGVVLLPLFLITLIWRITHIAVAGNAAGCTASHGGGS